MYNGELSPEPWLARHIKAAIERQHLLHRAEQLGKTASKAAQEWLYGEVPGSHRDIAMVAVAFNELCNQFWVIVKATVTPVRANTYKLQDIQSELELLTGSEHVARQIFDKMLEERVVSLNERGYAVFNNNAIQLPSPRSVGVSSEALTTQ